jgi:hypothetical protein
VHPNVLTLEQAAALASMPAAVARRHAASGRIPGVRIGRPWRFWRPSVLLAVTGVSVSDGGHNDLAEVVDAAALGELLGIPERTVCTLMRQKQIPGQKVAGRWRAHWPTIRHRISAGGPLVPKPSSQLQPQPRPRAAECEVMA